MINPGHGGERFSQGFPLEGITDIETLDRLLEEIDNRIMTLKVEIQAEAARFHGLAPAADLRGSELDTHIEDLLEQTEEDIRLAVIRGARYDELIDLREALLSRKASL